MMNMNGQRYDGYATGHPEGLHGIEARREKHPYVVEAAYEPGIDETTNGGVNQFTVHEPHLMNQHYLGYVQVVDIP